MWFRNLIDSGQGSSLVRATPAVSLCSRCERRQSQDSGRIRTSWCIDDQEKTPDVTNMGAFFEAPQRGCMGALGAGWQTLLLCEDIRLDHDEKRGQGISIRQDDKIIQYFNLLLQTIYHLRMAATCTSSGAPPRTSSSRRRTSISRSRGCEGGSTHK